MVYIEQKKSIAFFGRMIFAIVLALIACTSPIFLNFFEDVAIPEAIVCFLGFLLVLTYRFKMIIKKSTET